MESVLTIPETDERFLALAAIGVEATELERILLVDGLNNVLECLWFELISQGFSSDG